jgi:Asp-tRNA(Asn)/Glu-tRNA(Gln) amidotransferase A subunit family amidase
VAVDLDLAYASADDLVRRIASAELSPVEVVVNALERIDAVQPVLRCFTEVWADEALAAAHTAAQAVARGDQLGPLHGVPVAVKDTSPVAGRRTTLGSFTHEHWVPDRDAAVVRRLRAAGAILVGHTTTPEFAHTLVTDSPLWGPTGNPWDPTRSPGGSSGGSGAAVASGCVPLAEGSDMGGSVRIPAAWCGVVGLKPGIGRIPMDVLPALGDQLSHHGPLARCVDDARRFLAATAGHDPADLWSIPGSSGFDEPLRPDCRGVRIGLSLDLGCWAVDPEIEVAVSRTAELLPDAGAEVVDAGLVCRPRDELVWMELWGVFMAAYYGHLVDEHHERMDPDVLRLIELGRSLDAVHVKQLELDRTDLWRRVAGTFERCDVIVCPTMATAPVPAAKADRVRVPPPDDGRYHSDDMTAVWNLVAPCPAISVPCGRHADGMPIGLQVVAPPWREDLVLGVGAVVEALTPAIGRPPC